MQSFLVQHRDPNLRAYWVWGPFLTNDTAETARENVRRYSAPNSVHYWTPTSKYAQDLAHVLRMPAGRLAWDVYLLFKSGVIWDVDPPKPTYWQHQQEILQGDPLDIPSLETHLLEALSDPSLRK